MGWTTGVQFPAGAVMVFFSLRHRIQTGSGAPPTLLSNGYHDSFPGDKAAGGAKLATHVYQVPRL
jgi:hypothetical protein